MAQEATLSIFEAGYVLFTKSLEDDVRKLQLETDKANAVLMAAFGLAAEDDSSDCSRSSRILHKAPLPIEATESLAVRLSARRLDSARRRAGSGSYLEEGKGIYHASRVPREAAELALAPSAAPELLSAAVLHERKLQDSQRAKSPPAEEVACEVPPTPPCSDRGRVGYPPSLSPLKGRPRISVVAASSPDKRRLPSDRSAAPPRSNRSSPSYRSQSHRSLPLSSQRSSPGSPTKKGFGAPSFVPLFDPVNDRRSTPSEVQTIVALHDLQA